MSVERSQEQLYDVRLLDRHIRKNLIDDKAMKKWLKELPDAKDNVEYVSVADVFGDAAAVERKERKG